MSVDVPGIESLREIASRLTSNDAGWFREQYRSGGFAWMKDRLPDGEYEELGRRLDAGDLGWFRTRLASLKVGGGIFDGLGSAVGAVAGAVGGAAAGAAGAATGALGKGASAATGAAAAGTDALKGAFDSSGNAKKKPIWLLAAAGLAAVVVAAALLAKCGSSSSSDTTVAAAADTTAVASAETTVAAAETTAAVAAETTIAVTADTTVAASVDTAAAPTVVSPAGDLIATALSAGHFSTLAKAIDAAGLAGTLQGAGPFTVFAPTDDAFAKLPAGTLDSLLANKEALTKVLLYHVVPNATLAAGLTSGPVTSVEGSALNLSVDGSSVKVNDATVTQADITATNGVIHAIDSVLVPSDVDLSALNGPATTLAAAATPAPAPATPENLTVYFASGSAALDAAATSKIAGAVEQLKALPAGSKVNIVGHADTKGNKAKNQALSEQRAANVEAALKAGLGAAASNITFTSSAQGDSEPAADLAKSRRVTIEIQP